jgi:hypothetical protein
MPVSGILWDAVNATSTAIAGLNTGYAVVTDPRNARPMTFFLELPTVEAFTYNVGDITLRIRICAPPPGNQDASNFLLTLADTIMNSAIAVTDLRPGVMIIGGGQELPTYDLTVRVAVRRN